MGIRDWVRQFRGPDLDAGDLMPLSRDVDSLRRRRANIDKSRYHLLKLNRRLTQYFAEKDPVRRKLLGEAVGRRYQLLKELGIELPTDRRKLQAVTANLTRGM